MAKVRALRGVCVGIERHLKPGDVAEVDAALQTFLIGIGAVEVVRDPSSEPPATAVVVTKEDEQVVRDEAAATERAENQSPKSGKKEK